MNKGKSLACVLLSGALLMGGLAGCTKKPAENQATPTPSASASASPAPSVSVPLVETEDAIQTILGFPRDSAVLTIDGKEVSAEDFLYWLGYATEMVGYQNFGSPDAIDWEMDTGLGTTVTEYLMQSAKEMTLLYHVVEEQALAQGIALTEEDRAAIDQAVAQTIESKGGEDGYAKSLQGIGQSDAGNRRMLGRNYYYDHLKEKLFGAVAEVGDDEAIAWANDNGKMMVKHILFSTMDSSGAALPEAEKAAVEQKASDALAQLRAADDPIALFDQLMNEFSEDGRDSEGKLYSADGYFFGPGEMVSEFENASKALAENEISDLVESTYGYHIILRLPVDPEQARAACAEGKEAELQSKMDSQIDQWMDAATVETTALYDTITPKGYYEGLVAYRAGLDGADGGDASASPSATPEPSAAE